MHYSLWGQFKSHLHWICLISQFHVQGHGCNTDVRIVRTAFCFCLFCHLLYPFITTNTCDCYLMTKWKTLAYNMSLQVMYLSLCKLILVVLLSSNSFHRTSKRTHWWRKQTEQFEASGKSAQVPCNWSCVKPVKSGSVCRWHNGKSVKG